MYLLQTASTYIIASTEERAAHRHHVQVPSLSNWRQQLKRYRLLSLDECCLGYKRSVLPLLSIGGGG